VRVAAGRESSARRPYARPPLPLPLPFPDKATFPDLDVVGWYAAGVRLDAPLCAVLHTAASAAAGDGGAACGLLLDPDAADAATAGDERLPVAIVEPAPGGGPGATPRFLPAPFTIHASETERVAVQHAARAAPVGADGATASLVGHYRSLHAAVAALAARVESLHASLAAAAAGTAPLDHAKARAAVGLLARLPAPGADSASAAAAEGGALAALLLACTTRGLDDAAGLAEAVHGLVAARGRRGGGGGAHGLLAAGGL